VLPNSDHNAEVKKHIRHDQQGSTRAASYNDKYIVSRTAKGQILPRANQRLPSVKLNLTSVFGLGYPALDSLALFIVSVASHDCMSLIATIFLSGF
jgi:hypothetical protein